MNAVHVSLQGEWQVGNHDIRNDLSNSYSLSDVSLDACVPLLSQVFVSDHYLLSWQLIICFLHTYYYRSRTTVSLISLTFPSA